MADMIKSKKDTDASRKRKRESAPVACSSCRKQHLKCNGESPCQQCIKRKQESSCQFLAPQKRGPKSQELRQLIEQLQAENLQQRERLERYEAGFGLLPDDGSSSSSMSPSSPSSSPVSLKSVHLSLPSLTMAAESRALVTNRHIFHLGLLNQYLDTFLAYIHPHMKIMNAQPLLGPTRSSLLSLVYDPPKSLMGQAAYVQMNSLLALGARSFGNTAHAEEFITSARQALGQVFDEHNQLVASSLGLMAYYYGGSGDGQRGNYYNALAFQVCKQLGQVNNPIARRCLVAMALCEENCATRHKLIDRIARHPAPDINERIFSIFIRITSEISLNSGPADLLALVKKLKEIEQALKLSDAAAFTTQDPLGIAAVTNRILAFAARAHCFHSAGLIKFALEWANQVTVQLSFPALRKLFMGVVLATVVTIKIHRDLGEHEMLVADLRALYQLSQTYPLAGMLLRKCSESYRIDMGGLGINMNGMQVPSADKPSVLAHFKIYSDEDVLNAGLREGLGARPCNKIRELSADSKAFVTKVEKAVLESTSSLTSEEASLTLESTINTLLAATNDIYGTATDPVRHTAAPASASSSSSSSSSAATTAAAAAAAAAGATTSSSSGCTGGVANSAVSDSGSIARSLSELNERALNASHIIPTGYRLGNSTGVNGTELLSSSATLDLLANAGGSGDDFERSINSSRGPLSAAAKGEFADDDDEDDDDDEIEVEGDDAHPVKRRHLGSSANGNGFTGTVNAGGLPNTAPLIGNGMQMAQPQQYQLPPQSKLQHQPPSIPQYYDAHQQHQHQQQHLEQGPLFSTVMPSDISPESFSAELSPAQQQQQANMLVHEMQSPIPMHHQSLSFIGQAPPLPIDTSHSPNSLSSPDYTTLLGLSARGPSTSSSGEWYSSSSPDMTDAVPIDFEYDALANQLYSTVDGSFMERFSSQ